MRTALAIFIGMAVAAAALAGCSWLLTQQLHPLPAGFDLRSLRTLADYVESAPPAAILVLALATGIAALAGAWPAARVARSRGTAALGIGAPLMMLAIAGAALVPQPDWVPIMGMLLPIPLAVAGWRLAIPRREL